MPTLSGRLALALAALLLAGTIERAPAPRADALRVERSAGRQGHTANQAPERPRASVDVAEIRVTGRTLRVPAGGSLQRALDEARGGDMIALEPRATYRGPFRLPRKDGDGWIVIASAARTLPRPGRHVTPADARLMPKLVASSGSVFRTEAGAHHYRFVGLEIAPVEGRFLNSLVDLGNDDTSLETLPHHFVFDRSYIHGDPTRGARRGIAMNARHVAVVDSFLSDFKEAGADTQAIAAWNGTGPFAIVGNYLEAAGENVMFGGADPVIPDLVPADIEVVRNHFAKPLRWKVGHPTFEGTEWTVKNLFELKNARRVLIDGNLFEYNWPQAQNGFAILFTVRNQDGRAPWSRVEDVTFTNNLIRHVAAAINILGRDDNHPSGQTRRIAIRNNLFLDVGGPWQNGRLFQLLNGTDSVAIDHNTARQTGSILVAGDSVPHTGFVFQNNIAPHNEHGIAGSSTDSGHATLQRYFPGAVVRRNVIVGGRPGDYPSDNFFPATLDEGGLRYARAGTDGRDLGADVAAIERALGGMATVGPIAGSAQLGARSAPRDTGHQTRGDSDIKGAPWLVMGSVVELGFWGSLTLLVYVYLGYPLIAAIRATLRPRPRRAAPIEPTVSVLVVAHNEGSRVAARVENLLALDYPKDRLEIVVASDGSTDDTVAQARRYQSAGVTVCAFDRRRGKSAVINAVVPMVRSEIVVFADARQRFDPRSVRALAANFADPVVGAVSGELVVRADRDAAAAARGTALYWRYEKFIRWTEGRRDSTIGATGAIYAIRRSLFEPIPDDTILDDVLIPLRIVRRGFRVPFEPVARAYDGAAVTARGEFVRKARTAAGMFQLFAREPWLLVPWRNRLWFETLSHRALRLALPPLHAAVLGSNAALVASPASSPPVYGWLLAAQVTFYAAALAGFLGVAGGRRSIVFSIPCAVCLHSWVTLVGFARFLTRRQPATWEQASPAATASSASAPIRPASAGRSEAA